MIFITGNGESLDPAALGKSLESGDESLEKATGGKLYSEGKSMAPQGEEPEDEDERLAKERVQKAKPLGLKEGEMTRLWTAPEDPACIPETKTAKSLSTEGLAELEDLVKGGPHRYIHRRRGPKGDWIYEYPEQRKDQRGMRAAGQPGAAKPKPENFSSVASYLDAVDKWKAEGDWQPASGGSEKPFATQSGKRLQYVYQPRSGRHAYLDADDDVILTDEEAARYLPGGALARSLTGLEALEDLVKATPVGGLTPGGYRVKMAGGKRQYVKEGKAPGKDEGKTPAFSVADKLEQKANTAAALAEKRAKLGHQAEANEHYREAARHARQRARISQGAERELWESKSRMYAAKDTGVDPKVFEQAQAHSKAYRDAIDGMDDMVDQLEKLGYQNVANVRGFMARVPASKFYREPPKRPGQIAERPPSPQAMELAFYDMKTKVAAQQRKAEKAPAKPKLSEDAQGALEELARMKTPGILGHDLMSDEAEELEAAGLAKITYHEDLDQSTAQLTSAGRKVAGGMVRPKEVPESWEAERTEFVDIYSSPKGYDLNISRNPSPGVPKYWVNDGTGEFAWTFNTIGEAVKKIQSMEGGATPAPKASKADKPAWQKTLKDVVPGGWAGKDASAKSAARQWAKDSMKALKEGKALPKQTAIDLVELRSAGYWTPQEDELPWVRQMTKEMGSKNMANLEVPKWENPFPETPTASSRSERPKDLLERDAHRAAYDQHVKAAKRADNLDASADAYEAAAEAAAKVGGGMSAGDSSKFDWARKTREALNRAADLRAKAAAAKRQSGKGKTAKLEAEGQLKLFRSLLAAGDLEGYLSKAMELDQGEDLEKFLGAAMAMTQAQRSAGSSSRGGVEIGEKGGRIIGRTASGKKIYERKGAHDGKWSPQDHAQAAAAHKHFAQHAEKAGRGHDAKRHREAAQEHGSRAGGGADPHDWTPTPAHKAKGFEAWQHEAAGSKQDEHTKRAMAQGGTAWERSANLAADHRKAKMNKEGDAKVKPRGLMQRWEDWSVGKSMINAGAETGAKERPMQNLEEFLAKGEGYMCKGCGQMHKGEGGMCKACAGKGEQMDKGEDMGNTMPSGEPNQNMGTRRHEDGVDLDGKGKPSGEGSSKVSGSEAGAPAPPKGKLSDDDEQPESWPGGKKPLEKTAKSLLNGAVVFGGDSDAQCEALMKSQGDFWYGAPPAASPVAAPLHQVRECECGAMVKSFLSSCPECGAGAVQSRVLPANVVGGRTLEKGGYQGLRPKPQPADLYLPEGVVVTDDAAE